MTTPAVASRLDPGAVEPLATLDPAAPGDDLTWLDEAVGTARVVAIGESSHCNREFGLLRHRLLRHLVERHGFTGYALESGFGESHRVDAWVRGEGAPGRLDELLATGVTSLFGIWTETRTLLEWLRRHNSAALAPVGFHGVDLPGSQSNPLPGLDAVTTYLAEADPGFTPDPALRDTIAEYAASSLLAMPRSLAVYASLPRERGNAVTAGLADLAARMRARRIEYARRTGAETYERILRVLDNTIALDAMIRDMVGGNPTGVHAAVRDTAMADTVEFVLRGENRIVLAAHNAHVQRVPFRFPGAGAAATLGMVLAERLGDDYVAIGTTAGTGRILNVGPGLAQGEIFTDLEPPRPGSLDALLTATVASPRGLSAAGAARSGESASGDGVTGHSGGGSPTGSVSAGGSDGAVAAGSESAAGSGGGFTAGSEPGAGSAGGATIGAAPAAGADGEAAAGSGPAIGSGGAYSADSAFAVNLRRLSAADTAAVHAATAHRIGGMYTELDPVAAFDVLVHIPHLTPAEPDRAAIAHCPAEVREAFGRYRPLER